MTAGAPPRHPESAAGGEASGVPEATGGRDTGQLAARLAESEAETAALRTELEETSRGVVALYAELSDHQDKLEQARAEAEQASRAKASFLANMSHEIRSPLNAITGFASLLLDSGLSPEHAEYADTIRAAGCHLRDLVDDILDMSKIESGNLALESIPFDVVSCVEEAVDLVTLTAQQKNLPLAALFGPHVPDRVVGDPVRLRQIIVNLLSNAVKFTVSGAVTIEVTASPAGAAPSGGPIQLTLRVRDTGIGIANDNADRLFLPFTQADASTTRTFGGTGLGLTICRELAERMGGGIALESIPGTGSTFTCTITVQAVEPGPASAAADLPLHGTQILVLHGTDIVVEAIRRHLASWGADVVAARSAADAVHRAGEWSSAAVALVDAPDPTTLAERVSYLAKTHDRHLPTVALTPSTSRWALPTGTGAACAVLSTPVHRARLRAAVLSALGRPQDDAPDPAGVAQPAVVRDLRILLAEDNTANQRAATLMLARLGYPIDVVDDGDQAVAAILAVDYDLVLMDVHMAGTGGPEAARRTRTHRPGPRPRIVAVTASATQEIREECLAAGMDGFLAKPFELADLARVIAACPPRPPLEPAAEPGPAGTPPGPATPATVPAATRRARRVLYVDDNPMMVTLVQRMLSRDADLTLLTATRGDIALELATTTRPDIILLDLGLPDMSGEALLQRLLADATTRTIPAVIVSGDTSPTTVARLTAMGAAGYLSKPFDTAQLHEVLRRR